MQEFDDLKIDMASSNKSAGSFSAFQSIFEKMTKDMHFVGTFVIIYGVINCLSIIGALIGVPLILAGLKMKESADHFSFFRMTNNPASMKSGFEFQARYFHIFKILIIIMLVLIALSIILFIFFLSYFMSMFMHSSSFNA